MLLMKDIIDDHHPLIREISKPVEMPLSQEDEQLLRDMHEFLVNSQDEEMSEKYQIRPAVGIAAVQVGVLKRMCAIHVLTYDDEGNIKKTDDYGLVNPKIVAYTEKKSYLKDGEGCLSVNDDVDGYVPRYAKVTVKGYDIFQKQDITIVARGFLSICLQHELDHFDGKLFYDHIDKEHPKAPIPNAMVVE
ncbi:peptide deformylase [Candidatus Stoquefichus sp. SB1]|uniref:peptide deformylase n=1 Tax=Candidatus Stoquefichus sp. SB1 TaxID=1658109 RepID=UPI00067F5373|nr:peptide deformylase [Candidatus Stoquefichus sp. SB1]